MIGDIVIELSYSLKYYNILKNKMNNKFIQQLTLVEAYEAKKLIDFILNHRSVAIRSFLDKESGVTDPDELKVLLLMIAPSNYTRGSRT